MLKYRKITNKHFIGLFTIFLLTMGSEIVNNAIVVILFGLSLKKLRFRKIDLLILGGFLVTLVSFYAYSHNQLVLRFIIYIPRFVILIALAERYLSGLRYKELRSILRVVFLIHCSVILMCFIFPPLNNFLNVTLGKAFVSEFRISGLFSGYDFISFFTVLYLYVDYRCNDYKLGVMEYAQIFIGFSATIVSGRFGIIPYLIFFLYIFFKKINLTKIIAFGIACIAASFLFYERIMLFYNTFLLLRDSMGLSELEAGKLNLKDYGSEGQEGFYQLSPLVLYNEATLPFSNPLKYILPSFLATDVDSGPSYVIVNIGFILALCLYVFYFKSIYKGVKAISFFTILIMIMDIKFRIILVMMPTVWILLNLGRLKKYESDKLSLISQ